MTFWHNTAYVAVAAAALVCAALQPGHAFALEQQASTLGTALCEGDRPAAHAVKRQAAAGRRL